MLTDIQVLIFTGVIGAIISMFTARATTSSAAVNSLSMALASIRKAFEAIQREREVEVPAFPGWHTEDVYDK